MAEPNVGVADYIGGLIGGLRGELAPVVGLDHGRRAALAARESEASYDIVATEAPLRRERHALALEHIDHTQDTNRLARGEGVVNEIHGPSLVHGARLGSEHAHRRTLASLRARTLLREAFLAIEPSHTLVVHRPALALQQHVEPLVAVAHAHVRQLAQSLQ